METKLYEITENIAAILGEEDWTDETEQRLERLEMALEKKAENIVKFIGELESRAAYHKSEEERIAARRKAMEARTVRLKDYLKRNLELAGRTEVEAGTHKIAIQPNPPSVYVDAEQSIPPRFFVIVPQTTRLDKKAVADALKNGEDVPGARLVRGTSLRIR